MTGLLITLSIEGCAQPFASQSTAVPRPTPRPQGSVLYSYRGHSSRVTTVAWSPDGKYIASGSLDQTVQVWGANPNEHVRPFIYRGHTAGVQAVAWSPEGNRVVSGSIDKTVQVWDALTGEQSVLSQGHTDIVLTVAWSPDGRSIASGSADGTVRVWDSATGKQQYVYRGHTASVNSLVWSPDSQHIASGASDKTVHIIDATSGKHLSTYRGHTDTISSVSWSPDGTLIASGSWDKTVQVWHALTSALVYTYRGYNVQAARYDTTKGVLPDLILAVAWSHHGKRIAATTQVYCGDSCGIVLEWDAYTEQHLTFNIDLPIFALAWSPDDTRLVSSIVITTQDSSITAADGPYVQITQA
ncbi:MAG: hypothetical protein NVS4B11_04670 [Ktedonobacteraceae bacterium]